MAATAGKRDAAHSTTLAESPLLAASPCIRTYYVRLCSGATLELQAVAPLEVTEDSLIVSCAGGRLVKLCRRSVYLLADTPMEPPWPN